MGYIRVPVETNPETLAQDIYDYIQLNAPGWVPADGSLDVWIIKAVAAKAAENRTLASDVPDDIFGNLGASLFAIPPIDAIAATGDTTWTLLDNLGHTIPAGTYVALRDTSGNLVTFATTADVVVAPGSNITAVGEVGIRAVDTGVGGNALTNPIMQIDVLDWVASINIVAPTGGGVDAETNDDYLNRLSRKLQSLSTVPILPADFAIAAKDADPGVFRAVAIDLYNPLHNLLTANEADAETDASGWVNLANATIGSTGAQHANGAKSVSITSVAGGDMSAILNREVPISPGELITIVGSIRSAVSARSTKIGIRFIDAAHAIISTNYGIAANDSNAAWNVYTYSAVAPSNVAYVKIVVFVTATGGAAEVHYFDKLSIRHGAGIDWVQGDTPETNNIKTVTIAAVDNVGNPVSGAIKTNIENYIDAKREVNWVTHTMDANYTEIDVATTVTVLPGFDTASVHAAIVAAITNYFDPSVWGRDPETTTADSTSTWVDADFVYYNELITLVSNVAGVDRVVDLTSNIHGNAATRVDIAINGPAALTTVGTITVTP